MAARCCLWRAISLRMPLAKQGDREQALLLTRAYLAMYLSRYDRDLARELYGNLAAEAAAKLDAAEFAGAAKGLYAAAATVDPARAVDLYETLPAASPKNAQPRARGGLVDILSRHGDARWRSASDYLRMPMPWHGIE